MLKRQDSRPVPESRGEVRATLIVRNEALRLPQILEHHRALGVDRFFVVDNDSSDGTLDLLLGQPDTHVFFTDQPFRDGKALWRRWIFEEFCEGAWTLNLDADELFVFPHCEEMGLRELCRFLDAEGARGMCAALVDMYGDGCLAESEYRPGTPLLEACPLFDAAGYTLRYRRKPLAPPFRLDGGPRQRLFFEDARRRAPLRRALAAWLYRIDRRRPALPLRIPGLGPILGALARSGLPRRTPNITKLPLLRWGADLGLKTAWLDALHYVEPPIPISRCWGALLHFKLLADFRERAREAAAKALYGPSTDPEYRRYDEVLSGGGALPLRVAWSRRFESSRSLLEAGLMRDSPALAAFVERGRGSPASAGPLA